MKKLVILLALTMMLKPILPVFEYVFNYEYITTELCVNKDNLVMGCDGKCYLVKQLAKASDNEKPLSSDKKHASTETNDLFLADFQIYNLSILQAVDEKQVDSSYTNLYSRLNSHSFFHPPTFIS